MAEGTIVDRIAGALGFVSAEKAEAIRQTEAAKIVALITSGATASPFGTSITAPDRSYSQLVDSYASWVYTAIDKISKSVATLKLKLYVYRAKGTRAKVFLPGTIRAELKSFDTERERKKFLETKNLVREEIDGHPWLDLIGRPNPIMTRFILWYESIVRLELNGSFGWYMPKNRAGLPGEIWPLPLTRGATLVPRVSPDARIVSWNYKDGNVNQEFPPEEILFMKYPHPGSPFKGMSPLLAQTYPYDIDLYLMQRQKSLFENQAVPGLNLHTDQQLQPDQAKELMEFLDAQFAGVKRAGKSLVTHSGLKASTLSVSNRDAMITEVARQSREKILSAFDVSEGMVGLVRDVNRANMEGLTEMFVRDCLKPKTMLIEEYIEAFLLPRYDEGLSCDFVLPDIEDKEHELKAMETRLKNLVTTVDEERENLGKDPSADGWGAKPWIPSGMTQFGSEAPPQPGTNAPPKAAGEEGERFPPVNVFLDIDAKTPKRKVVHVKRNADGTLTGEAIEESEGSENGQRHSSAVGDP